MVAQAVKDMEEQQNITRNKVFSAISEYLTASGWVFGGDQMDFYWVDPVSGLSHRSDFAFIVQSERDAMRLGQKDDES